MTCAEAPADLAFSGVIGRRGRWVTARQGELRIEGRAETRAPGDPADPAVWSETVVNPDPEDWAAFWSTVDALAAWGWSSAGQLLRDGAPWRLQLAHGGRELQISGNGAEDYAPPGFRRFCLALDELADRMLLSADERRVLDAGFQLFVTVVMPEPRPSWKVHQHPTRQSLEAALAGAQMKSTSYLANGRVGWTWTAAEPAILRAAVEVLGTSSDEPVAELRDFTTGIVETLWPR